ncbi:hypothetical protein HAX54_020612 [Datura stramonium]|uniref:Uncharacterized protein n=1 Tax=Datura stramonium TaxID=4076 RepID=A0ABS8URF7_DATST|nr:hypothetical protein [Datura stramonium]
MSEVRMEEGRRRGRRERVAVAGEGGEGSGGALPVSLPPAREVGEATGCCGFCCGLAARGAMGGCSWLLAGV